MENQLVKKDDSIFMGKLFDTITSTNKAIEVGQFLITSGLAPKHFNNNPSGLMIAMEAGIQLGLNWFQSMHSVVPINGVPSLAGDASKAIILTSGVCEDWQESDSGKWTDKNYVYTIKTKRKGMSGYDTTSFSFEDAELAGLLSKPGPWKQYPKRMIRYRALGFHARDYFPDVIKGFKTQEEASDYPEVVDQGYAQEVHPQNTTEALDFKNTITDIGSPKKKLATQKPPIEKEKEILTPEEKVVQKEIKEAIVEHKIEQQIADLPQEMFEEDEPEVPEEEPVDLTTEEIIEEKIPEPETPKVEEKVKKTPGRKPKGEEVLEDVMPEDPMEEVNYEDIRNVIIEAQGGVLLKDYTADKTAGERGFPTTTEMINKLLIKLKGMYPTLPFTTMGEWLKAMMAPGVKTWDVIQSTSPKGFGKTLREAYCKNADMNNNELFGIFMKEPENGLAKAIVNFAQNYKAA